MRADPTISNATPPNWNVEKHLFQSRLSCELCLLDSWQSVATCPSIEADIWSPTEEETFEKA